MKYRMTGGIIGIALALALVTCSVWAESTGNAPRANRHAVIIGVGNYVDPRVSPLKGVVHDVENARSIAKDMGVPESNMRVLQDREASYANIRQALRDLAVRMRDGDRVFIYYSGHGTRFVSPDNPNVCREALIPADVDLKTKSGLLTQVEIAADLAPVYAKADKVFLFFDACHSGGVQARQSHTRSKRLNPAEDLEPKFFLVEGPANCRIPSNVKTRTARQEAVSRGAPANNVVQLSSSRPDEVSLDSPATGGLVTSAWRYCSTYAEDVDNSGTLSVGEISSCVQDRVNTRLKNQERFTGQHLVVSGSTDFAPFRDGPSDLGVQKPGGEQTASAPLPRMLPVAEPSKPAEQTAPLRPQTADAAASRGSKPPRLSLETILAQSDARHVVSVDRKAEQLKIGRDSFDLSIKSSRGGYVYLVLQSSDNESTYVIFPNALDQSNKVSPDQWLHLPRPSWRLQSTGPAGTNRLLVIVADAPRSLAELRAKPDGPFVKTLNDRSAAQSLAWVVGNASGHSLEKCATEFASKDLEYVEHCSDSFGAAVVEFHEVR